MDLNYILLNLGLAAFFLILVVIYGYYIQSGLSIGGMLLSINFDNNYLITVFLPPLLITIVSILMVYFNFMQELQSLWLSSIFLFGYRFILILIFNKIKFYRLSNLIASGLLSIIFSFGISRLIVRAGPSLRLNSLNAAILVWIIGVGLLVYIVNKILPKNFSNNKTQATYIISLYKKYFNKYNKHLDKRIKSDKLLSNLFFAIMITEDINRPAIFRFSERLFFATGFIKTTGIMQVTSTQKLSDMKSIILAQALILDYYTIALTKNSSEFLIIKEIAYKYNDGFFYTDLIIETYYLIKEYNKIEY